MGGRRTLATVAFAAACLAIAPTAGAQSPENGTPKAPPDKFKPADDAQPDVWIFSGELQGSGETFSGTLVAGKGDAEFELKLAGGATCDASKLVGDVGLVRLPEITCSDDRPLRALFVPQGGKELKVFGHVGSERFVASAHLLGTEAIPEKKQTAEPTAPKLERKPPDGQTPSSPQTPPNAAPQP